MLSPPAFDEIQNGFVQNFARADQRRRARQVQVFDSAVMRFRVNCQLAAVHPHADVPAADLAQQRQHRDDRARCPVPQARVKSSTPRSYVFSSTVSGPVSS